MNLAGGILNFIIDSYSKEVRHFNQWVLSYLETLRPLVAPSLRSGRHSPGAFGSLNNLEPLVSMSNYYIYTYITEISIDMNRECARFARSNRDSFFIMD